MCVWCMLQPMHWYTLFCSHSNLYKTLWLILKCISLDSDQSHHSSAGWHHFLYVMSGELSVEFSEVEACMWLFWLWFWLAHGEFTYVCTAKVRQQPVPRYTRQLRKACTGFTTAWKSTNGLCFRKPNGIFIPHSKHMYLGFRTGLWTWMW